MRTCLLFCLTFAISFAGRAEPVPDAAKVLNETFWESADYLAAGDPNPYEIDHRQQFAAVLGREDLIQAEIDFWTRTQPGGVCGEGVGDPVQTLTGAATSTQIVVLNENHMIPLHRADPLGLIDALIDAGYRYYAYESFADSIMNRGGRPIGPQDVFYSADPAHARLLAQLESRGVTLVAYESSDHPDGREAAQAQRLKERVFDTAPQAKLIIVPGHDHVFEHVEGWAGQMMARRLKALTGIDPLTISQTACVSATGAPVLTQTLAKEDGTTAQISETDFALGHPPMTFTNNRPDWRRSLGDQDVAIPARFTGLDVPVIIEARRLEIDEQGRPVQSRGPTLPLDRVLLLPGETGIPLLLPAGHYRIEAFDRNGPVGPPEEIVVAPAAPGEHAPPADHSD